MTERDPVFQPRRGDIVRSEHDSIGERQVIHVADTGVRYIRVHPKGYRNDGYCLPSVWTKWCRAHRVTIVQRGGGALAACQLKSSDRHLIEVIREQEEQLVSYRNDDSDILRAWHSREDEHRRALVKAEQDGYDKGVKDGRELEYGPTIPELLAGGHG